MKILVTGAKGFVGKNLCAQLNNIREGKNKSYGDLTISEVFEYDIDSTLEQLDRYCQSCDFVFNLAGVNRPQSQEEFMQGNFGFASNLLDTLKKQIQEMNTSNRILIERVEEIEEQTPLPVEVKPSEIEDVVTESEIEDVTPVETTPTVIKTKADRDREAIEEALKASGGNRKVAADMLGISERTLYRKLKGE